MKFLKSIRVFFLIVILACLPISGGIAFGDETDALVVDETGNVSIQNSLSVSKEGIGTTNPQSRLHIVHQTQASGDDVKAGGLTLENTLFGTKANIYAGWYSSHFLQFTVNDEAALTLIGDGTATFYKGLVINNTAKLSKVNFSMSRFVYAPYGVDWAEFDMDISGYRVLKIWEQGSASFAGSVSENSDINLKKDIVKIDKALEKVIALRGVNYKWKDEKKRGKETHIGLIAQEVEAVYPEAVLTDGDGVKSICYGNLIAPLIEAVKELKAENDALKEDIKDMKKNLQAENTMMKKELQMLREQMLALTVANTDKNLARK